MHERSAPESSSEEEKLSDEELEEWLERLLPEQHTEAVPLLGYPAPGYTLSDFPYHNYEAQLSNRFVAALWGVVLLGCATITLFVVSAFVGSEVNHSFHPWITPPATAIPYPNDDFYHYLAAHEYEKAHALLSPTLAAQYTLEILRSRWEGLEQAEGTVVVLRLMNPDSSRNDGRVTTSWQVATGAGSDYRITLFMHLMSDSWKIVKAEPNLIPPR
jgi:hypothetical protein